MSSYRIQALLLTGTGSPLSGAQNGEQLIVQQTTKEIKTMSTNTLDISTLNDDQIAAIVAEQRKRKMAKVKSERYAKFQPTYDDYRNAVTNAKKAVDLKKSLLKDLKALGFGQKAKTTPTTKRRQKEVTSDLPYINRLWSHQL